MICPKSRSIPVVVQSTAKVYWCTLWQIELFFVEQFVEQEE